MSDNQRQDADYVAPFEADLIALRPLLADLTWRDLWRRWMDVRRQLPGSPNSSSNLERMG